MAGYVNLGASFIVLFLVVHLQQLILYKGIIVNRIMIEFLQKSAGKLLKIITEKFDFDFPEDNREILKCDFF